MTIRPAEWARLRGFPTDAEHILVHGVPVQFLPAHNALAESAVTTARTLDYEDVPVRVIDPEHLVALAFQAGGHKRRERAWQMLEVGAVNRQRLRDLLSAHGIMMEKVRILLQLQQQDLPLLAKQRPLRAWEKPWPVEP